jgi:hypothetical protein
MIERLNLEYRWNPRSSCLEAKYDDEPDEPHNWKVSMVPSVQAAIGIPGEIEAMIAARDRAVSEVVK